MSKCTIFIGPGRSGSTIVSEFVLAHEDLAWPVHYLEFLPGAPQLDLFRRAFDNRYWSLTGEKAQINKTRFMNMLIPYPAEAYAFWERILPDGTDFSRSFLLGETATAEQAAKVNRAISGMVRRQGRDSFAMKFTGPGRIGYLKSIFPDARFINVVRDPVATVNSLMKVGFWKENGMRELWWRGAYSALELEEYEFLRRDPAMGTAYQLRKILRTTEREAADVGADMLTVRYEDFCTDAERAVGEILDFAGLPASPAIERKVATTTLYDRPGTDALDDKSVAMIKALFEMECGDPIQGGRLAA